LTALTLVAHCNSHIVALTVVAELMLQTASKSKAAMNQVSASSAQVAPVWLLKRTVSSNLLTFKRTPIALKEPFVATTVSVDRPAHNTTDAPWELLSDAQSVNVPTSSLNVPVSRRVTLISLSDASQASVSLSQQCALESSVPTSKKNWWLPTLHLSSST
jgi:hypothetical protein